MRLITTSRADTLTIGNLSELTGVNIETIRYYERTKVLPAPRRSESGRRVYQAADIRTLAFFRRARELGFSLTEIRTLLRLGGPRKALCRDVRRIAAHHLEDIRSKISDLHKLERLLASTVARCTGTTAPDCPVLDVLELQIASASALARTQPGWCGEDVVYRTVNRRSRQHDPGWQYGGAGEFR